MTLTSIKTGMIVLAACYFTACGMEPSGGNDGSSAAVTNGNTQPTGTSAEVQTPESTGNSSDATQAGVAVLPEGLEAINTTEVAACHAKGNIYDRRTIRCSKSVKLAATFSCDKDGITEAFKSTGYQVDEALKAAAIDGFSLDQCGETEAGRRIAYFVRADEDGTHSLREIETKQIIK